MEELEKQAASPVVTPSSTGINTNTLWKMPARTAKAAADAALVFGSSHGMFAGVPILCKDSACPFIDTCMIDPADRSVGGRCPQEAGTILARFDSYCRHFNIDIDRPVLKEEDVVDATMVKDLVDLEVQILRAENKIAVSAEFLDKVVAAIDSRGKAYYDTVVSAEAEFKIKLLDKKHKILTLLNATRKDKAAQLKNNDTPSVRSINIYNKVNQKLMEQNSGVIDVEIDAEEEML